MKHILFYILIASLHFGCSSTRSAFQLQQGWRLPIQSEIVDNWEAFAKPGQPVHYAFADFNGDNIKDVAYIALSTRNKSWALFVNLNSVDGLPEIIKLDEEQEGTPPQTMGVSVAEPGKYKTACGKGYWECESGESPELELQLPAIDYYQFESANSFIWWDKGLKKFIRTWISD